MIDEDGHLPDGSRVALEYDFLKHLTSLSLFAIGGGVTFAGSIFADVVDKRPLWLAVAAFGLSALMAFYGQLTLIEGLDPERRSLSGWRGWLLGRPSRSPGTLRTLAVSALAVGVGMLTAFAMEHLR